MSTRNTAETTATAATTTAAKTATGALWRVIAVEKTISDAIADLNTIVSEQETAAAVGAAPDFRETTHRILEVLPRLSRDVSAHVDSELRCSTIDVAGMFRLTVTDETIGYTGLDHTGDMVSTATQNIGLRLIREIRTRELDLDEEAITKLEMPPAAAIEQFAAKVMLRGAGGAGNNDNHAGTPANTNAPTAAVSVGRWEARKMNKWVFRVLITQAGSADQTGDWAAAPVKTAATTWLSDHWQPTRGALLQAMCAKAHLGAGERGDERYASLAELAELVYGPTMVSSAIGQIRLAVGTTTSDIAELDSELRRADAINGRM